MLRPGCYACHFQRIIHIHILNKCIYECSPADALVEAFVRTDVAFRDELDSHRKSRRVIQKDWHPGCTAAVALIVKNKLFVANAGDCRTILCRRGCPVALSRVSLLIYLNCISFIELLRVTILKLVDFDILGSCCKLS